MPYCCQCGNQTRGSDVYCGVCGARQPVAAPAVAGISPRTAAILCYLPVVGWIPAIIVLASRQFRQDLTVRFHAFQGIYLFVLWLIVDWILGPMAGFRFLPGSHRLWLLPGLGLVSVLKIFLLGAWIFMLMKVSHGEHFRLPILGELADRSVAEQK